MKKLVFLFVAMAIVSCATTTVHQMELYGVVEDVVSIGHQNHAKVWCAQKQKYYDVVSERVFQIGDTIKIK